MIPFTFLIAIMIFLWYKADKWRHHLKNNKENDDDLK